MRGTGAGITSLRPKQIKITRSLHAQNVIKNVSLQKRPRVPNLFYKLIKICIFFKQKAFKKSFLYTLMKFKLVYQVEITVIYYYHTLLR